MKKLLFFSLFFLFASISFSQNDKIEQAKGIALLKSESAKTLRNFPSAKKIEESKDLTDNGKTLFKKIRTFLEEANKVSDKTSFDSYSSILKELDWAMLMMNVATTNTKGSAGGKDIAEKQRLPGIGMGGGGIFNGDGGNTCVTNCKNDYNRCMRENDCSHSILCLCCIPCSLQYMGCVAGCSIP